jgi:hypothetical protein
VRRARGGATDGGAGGERTALWSGAALKCRPCGERGAGLRNDWQAQIREQECARGAGRSRMRVERW